MSNKSIHTQEEFEAMALEYTSGVTLVTLATKWAVTVPTMAKYVKKGGGVLRRRGQRRKSGGTVTGRLSVVATPTIEPEVDSVTTDAIVETPAMVTRQILAV